RGDSSALLTTSVCLAGARGVWIGSGEAEVAVVPGAKPAIVLIHGLGLKVSETDELDKWKGALESNLANEPGFAVADLRMAYYSDELHPEVHRIDAARRRGAAPEAATLTAQAAVEEELVD